MKNITEILKDYGVEIAADKQADFNKAVSENYKTVAEVEKKIDKLNTELTEAKTQKDELQTEITKLQGNTVELETLKNKVKGYEEADAERQKKADADAKENALRERFKPLKGDKQFHNDFTENGAFEMFKKAVAEANGKSDAELYAEIEKNADLYKNPNEKFETPPANGKNTEKHTFKNFF